MHRSRHWSSGSAAFRCEWRPSRWSRACLIVLGLLGACATLLSEMPGAAALPLAGAAVIQGLTLAWRDGRKTPVSIIWDQAAQRVLIDGQPAAQARLTWRGALAILEWSDGGRCRQRLALWPDVLSAAQRRELRLAAGVGQIPSTPASMAP